MSFPARCDKTGQTDHSAQSSMQQLWHMQKQTVWMQQQSVGATVRADGEGKWIKKANEMADAVSRKPRVFPVLEPRKKKASGGMSYKEALAQHDGSDSE